MTLEDISKQRESLEAEISGLVQKAKEADGQHRAFMGATQQKVNELNADLLRLEGRQAQIEEE